MKHNIIIILLFLFMIPGFGQEKEAHTNVILTDSTWVKEHFEFPISFAQEIPYQGFEEAVFPKGWSAVDSPNFWSYAFVWYISSPSELKAKDLKTNLELYFNGLLGVDSTFAEFDKTEDSNATTTHYTGQIKTIDTRYTKQPITLHTTAMVVYCNLTKKCIILFRFSPKTFDHEVWFRLNQVTLKANPCALN